MPDRRTWGMEIPLCRVFLVALLAITAFSGDLSGNGAGNAKEAVVTQLTSTSSRS